MNKHTRYIKTITGLRSKAFGQGGPNKDLLTAFFLNEVSGGQITVLHKRQASASIFIN